jgi:hypothetical protein
MQRRMAGLLKTRLPETGLEQVDDRRKARGKRWLLATVLKTCIAAILAGCKSLSEAESLTDEMSPSMAKLLGMGRRLPDTTVRDVLCTVASGQLRACIHRQIGSARRRKALGPEGLPFGVVAIDGKSTAIDAWDNRIAQRHRDASGLSARGLIRTLTCTLVSSRAKVCVDAVPIPPKTNEMGHFGAAFRGLLRVYGRKLFQVVSTDAGMCSLENANAVTEENKDYLFCLKADQPGLLAEARRLLQRKKKALAETLDVDGRHEVRRRLYKTDEMAGWGNWRHLVTVLRVESSKVDLRTGREVEHESRYFISSLASGRLTDQQWLYSVRQHWAVENQCHHTWDAVLREDKRPWIRADPQGALAVMLLRRLAYNMLALFRSVSQRSEHRRRMPFRDILRAMYNAMLSATEGDITRLRARPASGYG